MKYVINVGCQPLETAFPYKWTLFCKNPGLMSPIILGRLGGNCVSATFQSMLVPLNDDDDDDAHCIKSAGFYILAPKQTYIHTANFVLKSYLNIRDATELIMSILSEPELGRNWQVEFRQNRNRNRNWT